MSDRGPDQSIASWRAPAETPAASEWPRSRRSRAAFAYLATFSGAFGLLIGVLAWYRPAPGVYVLPIWIAEYASPLIPRVPHAVEDGRALLSGGYLGRAVAVAPSAWSAADIDRELGRLGALSPDDIAAIHLSGVSLCDPSGRVAILPSDARLERPEGWIPLGRVLDALRRCPARYKFLVLDTFATPPPEATLVYPGDPAGAVDAELERVEDPRRLVLTSCSAGEVALGSDALGRSAFGLFLERGLRGEADGSGIGGRKDRRVTARELAAYVIDRVERWSHSHRGLPQTPRMLAGAATLDFPVRTVGPGSPPPIPSPEAAAYPAWLRDGWAWRDSLRDASAGHDSPGLVRRVEALLLRAEGDWRGGYDPEQVRLWAADELAGCRRSLEARAPSPAPRPVSLAQEIAAGRTPDRQALEPIGKTLAGLDQAEQTARPEERPAARDKLAAELAKSLAAADDFSLAWAVWQAAIADPRPDRLAFLQKVLGTRQPTPRYMETLWLSRIVRPSSPAPAWPADVVGDLVEGIELGEAADVRPRSFAWVRPALDAAASARHDAEALALVPGYAPLDRVRRELDRSRALLTALRGGQSKVESARDSVERALTTLSVLRADLDRHPARLPAWRRTLRAAGRVLAELDRGRMAGATSSPDMSALRRSVGWLDEQSAALGDDLGARAVDRLVANAADDADDGATITAIAAILATPIPRAADRVRLWDARQAISRRIDMAEDPSGPSLPGGSPRPAPGAPGELERRRRLASSELLALAGLPPPPTPFGADQDLRAAWLAATAGVLNGPDPWKGDRVERLAPLFALEAPGESPSWRLHLAERSAVWAWLAGRYRYESLDSGHGLLETVAAVEFARAVQGPAASSIPAPPSIELPAVIPAMDLRRPGIPSRYELEYRVAGVPANPRPTIELFNPDDAWMTLRTGTMRTAPGAPGGRSESSAPGAVLPIVGEARDDLTTHATPPPPGFLARITTGGWSFHAHVPVELSPQPTVTLRLGRDPDRASEPLDVIRLRPTGTPEVFFIHAENRTADTRKVAVEVRDDSGSLVASAEPAAIVARGVARLPLKAASGSKPAPLRGPLHVVARDPDRPAADPIARTFPVVLRSPWDYLEVVEVQYVPPDPLIGRVDRLIARVRQSAPIAGPAPLVSLSLTPDRPPGYVSAAGGTFRVALDPSGAVATLEARGLQFRGGPPPEATFDLDADGYERAFRFRTTFPADGDPVTPVALSRPAIAIAAPEFAASSTGLDVRLQVDRAPEDAAVRLDLLASDSPRAAIEIRTAFAAPRDVRVQAVPPAPDAPTGGLALSATIEDWSAHLDTRAIEGRRALRASIRGRGGAELVDAARIVHLEQGPATGVQILGMPGRAGKGKTLTASAVAVPSISGTQQVDFFFGKPPQAGPLPADAKLIAATRVGTTETWSALITLPDDKLGPLDLSARFLSRAGLEGFGTTTVQVLAADPVPLGQVVGRVQEGGLPQAGLDVSLLDAQGRAVLKVKSQPDGTFTFKGVALGQYRASAARPDAGTSALSDTFDVVADAPASVVLDLSL